MRRSAVRGSLSAIRRAENRLDDERSDERAARDASPPSAGPSRRARRSEPVSATAPIRESWRSAWIAARWLDGTVLNSSRNGRRFPESAFMRRRATRESAEADSVMTDSAEIEQEQRRRHRPTRRRAVGAHRRAAGTQGAREPGLQAHHRAVVHFVIIAEQVQIAVDHEEAQLAAPASAPPRRPGGPPGRPR